MKHRPDLRAATTVKTSVPRHTPREGDGCSSRGGGPQLSLQHLGLVGGNVSTPCSGETGCRGSTPRPPRCHFIAVLVFCALSLRGHQIPVVLAERSQTSENPGCSPFFTYPAPAKAKSSELQRTLWLSPSSPHVTPRTSPWRPESLCQCSVSPGSATSFGTWVKLPKSSGPLVSSPQDADWQRL